MRVLVLGGDGYLGWPTALHLSRAGYEVGVADNFARRGYDLEMGVDSLVPIASLHRRVDRWEEVSGTRLEVFIGDLTEEAVRLRHGRRASGPTPSSTSPSSAAPRTPWSTASTPSTRR